MTSNDSGHGKHDINPKNQGDDSADNGDGNKTEGNPIILENSKGNSPCMGKGVIMCESGSDELSLDTNALTVMNPKRNRMDGPEAVGGSGPNTALAELKVNDPKNHGLAGSGLHACLEQ